MSDHAPSADASHPPAIALNLVVGVTGHREPEASETRPQIAALLGGLTTSLDRLSARESAFFADVPPVRRLVTALADGADQLVAEEALAAGYQLQAILPLPREDYSEDFDDPARLDALLAASAGRLELPPTAKGRPDAYALVGRAAVAHSDVLIAIWDGKPARGRGGTADVVAHALRRGLPVIHVPADGGQARIIWSGYEAFVEHESLHDMPSKPVDADNLDILVARLLGPPEEETERGFLRMFLAERERNLKVRIEYPLLLAATGVRRLRRSVWRTSPYGSGVRAEWLSFRAACEDKRHGVSVDLDLIEQAYAWSDRLAQHFAQVYRSGHVFNFLFAAIAVLLALTGLLIPDTKLWLASAELGAILAFVINTRLGIRGAWHRRWLDYRQLAERVRSMRSLKLLGAARPDLRARPGRDQMRWVDWYAAGVWRQSGCTSGAVPAQTGDFIRFLVAEEIDPQIAYHRASARDMHHFDHKLHNIGSALFAVSIISCLAFIIGYLFAHDFVKAHAVNFVFLSAGLPAMGTAIFGIRMQGDFNGTAERSLATADVLAEIRTALLAPELTFARAVDLFEAAARAMLADLGEWRLAYQQRKLELPG